MARSTKFLIALVMLVGASVQGHAIAGNQGILAVQIKDHREAIGDFHQLIITVDKISISPKPGLKIWQAAWKELSVTSEPFDLTKYIDTKTVQVFRAPIDSGVFDAFHLKVKTAAGVLKKNQRKVPIKNTIGPFKLAYEVRPNSETLLILDLVVSDMSDHPPRGYELGLQGYELFVDGKLAEKIPPG